MSQDWVDLDPQAVSNGLAAYEQASSTMNANWQGTIAAIQAKNNPTTWGTDEAGQKFSSQYEKGGAMEFGAAGGEPAEVLALVTGLGPKVRTAVENSLTADQAQGKEMTIEVKGL